jgi:carboxyl-terminal processing protease
MVANGILYINIPNFEHNSIHEDFQKLLDATNFSAVKGLILDVRLNMGGSSSVCNHIVERLINKPVSSPLMKYPHYIAAEKAWGKEEKWETVKSEIGPVEGKKYTGPIVILTDAVTISTAEDLIIELRQRGQVLTMGETTAGGAGNGLLSPLPGGGQFRVSTFHATCPDGTEYVGSGLKPDILAAPTLQDLCEGNDVVLQKGIRVISDWGTFYTPGKK